jgi:DHA1 family tetracycline resistance protein-like MFS transporter
MTDRKNRPGPLVFWVVLVDLIGFGVVLPLLPSRAAEFTESRTLIGIAVAAFSFMQFLLAPWWGRLSDRVGRRPVLMLGFLGSAISYVLFAVAGNYVVLLFSRILAGGIGATVNVAQAALADVTPPEGRSRAMGLIGVAFGLGFIVGPAIAGISSSAGAHVPGFIAAGLCLASLLLAWLKLPETRVAREPVPPTTLAHWFALGTPGAAMFLSVIAFAVITVIFPLYASQELNLGRRSVSSFFVVMGLASAVVQAWAVGRLAPRWGERALMVIGGVLLALGLAAIPLTHAPSLAQSLQLPAFLLALTLLAAGSGLLWPAAAALVSRRTVPSEQGAVLGALHSVASAARVVGPVLMGWIGEEGGFHAAFLVAGALALVSALFGWSVRRAE